MWLPVLTLFIIRVVSGVGFALHLFAEPASKRPGIEGGKCIRGLLADIFVRRILILILSADFNIARGTPT